MVEPDCVTDDFGWEPMTPVGIHHPIIDQRWLSCQYLFAAQLRNAGLASQTFQYDPDLLFG